jgi:hypothetical protein
MYYHCLLEFLQNRPSAAAAMLQHPLHFDHQWMELLRVLDAHLGQWNHGTVGEMR